MLAERWHALLSEDHERTPRFCLALAKEMRARRLTFGTRVHCPFLRPVFLTAHDEDRIRVAAETVAAAAERVAAAALESRALFDQLGIREDEERLVRLEPGYARASTASRVDAFLLPDSLHFAEYNGESPAGPGYTQRLCELFDELEAMARFKAAHEVRFHRTIDALLGALLESYRDWGGTASPPLVAIVDFREVPTWTEFEILRAAFEAAGVPAIVCDPRELTFEEGALFAQGRRVDLVYRRVLVNDIIARPEDCSALVAAYAARAVPVANTFRCKLPHKKAFFGVLTDPRNAPLFSAAELEVFRAHVPWTRLVEDRTTERAGREESVLEIARREREQLVLKPNDEYGGKGVLLGWEATQGEWDSALEAALRDPRGSWIVQARIPVRRELFPRFDDRGVVAMEEVLVDLAPYIFCGRLAGYLTRLSSTGLANVTAGGGQVPAFVVMDGPGSAPAS